MHKPVPAESDRPTVGGEPEAPFSSNAVRLSPGEWMVALLLTGLAIHLIPAAWRRAEPLEAGADYRVPYRLSNDYWLAARYFGEACARDKALVLGDSVVWGHYVGTAGTLSHYLNEAWGEDRFANLGIDGIHPVALAGLVEHYGGAISGRDVILHGNFLWMSSKRHDLQVTKEFTFNHPSLVPQFWPRIPCYRESLSGRLGIVVGRAVPFLGWTKHVEIAYFDNADLARWTIGHPYANPGARITFALPSPDEPPSPEPVAKPWTERGIRRFSADWVALETSLQWRSLRRTIEILRRRGNRVFVVIGPFNEHMLTDASLAVYRQRKQEAETWLRDRGVPCTIPAVLPSEVYADASHPLSEGYRLLAQRLADDEAFRAFTGMRGQ